MLSQLNLEHAIFSTSNLDFHPKSLQKKIVSLVVKFGGSYIVDKNML